MSRPTLASLLAIGATALALGGCTSKSYCIRRAALVPLPSPMLRPARQAQGYVEANVGTEAALWAKPPKKLAGANVGLYVPQHQLAGYLLFSPVPVFSLGFSYEVGYPQNALPISHGLIAPPTLAIGGTGMHMALHFKVDRDVTIGWSCDLWMYTISSRIAAIESDSCEGLPDPRTWDNWQELDIQFTGRTQLAVGLDFDWSYLTMGFGLRNQPHNVDESLETHHSTYSIEPRISHAIYPYVYLSWEFRLRSWLHLGVTAYQPLNFDPIIYAPIIGFNLRVTHVARERNQWKGPPPTPVPVNTRF